MIKQLINLVSHKEGKKILYNLKDEPKHLEKAISSINQSFLKALVKKKSETSLGSHKSS